MDIHNMAEDWVIAEVDSFCEALAKNGEDPAICTCDQCRQDAVCYVLNRTPSHYVVSHRGVARIAAENLESQQSKIDRTALVHEAIRRVSHNQRLYADHGKRNETGVKKDVPLFNIPAIMGRAFNGLNFSPVAGSDVSLIQNGKLVEMRDVNWQNPCRLVPGTNGFFTFWPSPAPASGADIQNVFHYTIKISGGGFENFSHSFTVPVQSEIGASSFSMKGTFKLPDFHLFPPGEEEAQRIISE